MTRFKFKVIQAESTATLEELLNEHGADGWNIHGWQVVTTTNGLWSTYTAVLSKDPNA
jgi:hypothetical protein